jgi:CheY-like chemotaxis protein
VKILLVEDSRAIRLENERALIQAGYEVICAEDGQRALQLAGERLPDLILLDLLLPKVSEVEVLEYLKSNPGTAQIPVVVLSALSEKNREKLMAAGAEDYLEKNTLMANGQNMLPRVLEDVICRINRKRGIPFTSVPISN